MGARVIPTFSLGGPSFLCTQTSSLLYSLSVQKSWEEFCQNQQLERLLRFWFHSCSALHFKCNNKFCCKNVLLQVAYAELAPHHLSFARPLTNTHTQTGTHTEQSLPVFAYSALNATYIDLCSCCMCSLACSFLLFLFATERHSAKLCEGRVFAGQSALALNLNRVSCYTAVCCLSSMWEETKLVCVQVNTFNSFFHFPSSLFYFYYIYRDNNYIKKKVAKTCHLVHFILQA